METRGQEPNARMEGTKLSVLGGHTFREDQDAPAAVNQIACEMKTLQESRLLWKRKNMEQGHNQEIADAIKESLEESRALRGVSHGCQLFTTYGRCQAVAKTRGQSGEN